MAVPKEMKKEAARLEKVYAILTNAKVSIRSVADVAAEHEFTDLLAFSKAFKAKYGMTPAETRKFAKKKAKPGRR